MLCGPSLGMRCPKLSQAGMLAFVRGLRQGPVLEDSARSGRHPISGIASLRTEQRRFGPRRVIRRPAGGVLWAEQSVV